MRVGFARVVHRSNSFARTTTTFEDFAKHDFQTGPELTERYMATGSVLGGIIDSANNSGVEAIPLIATSAPASGPVHDDTVDQLAIAVCDAIEQHSESETLDALLIELTGAMLTISGKSGDELLVTRIRDTFSNLPIGLILSPQANVTTKLAESCSFVECTWTAADGDLAQVGRNSLEIMSRVIQEGSKPGIHVERLPLLIPISAQRASDQPLADIASRTQHAREREGILSAVLCAGYPYADAAHTGASIVLSGSGSLETLACKIRDELWSRRNEFFVQGSNVEEAVHHAMASKQGPVLIADLGDNPDDGAPGDGTTILWALLDLGVRNATVGAIADDWAVDACFRAGQDANVEIPIGGRRDTRHGYPIDISGKVISLHDGPFRLKGPIDAGLTVDAGRLVVLDVEARHDGRVELILSEKPVQITDEALFEHIGVDIRNRAIVSIKSANDYRPAFEPIASEIFEVITPGITTPDPAFFEYQHVRRPIYPLDPCE